MMCIIIIGRLVGVWGVHYLIRMCQKESEITIPELSFISYGGMIRGAIAFGLVLKIPEGDDGSGEFKERGVIVTTTLAIVIITTVIFGSFMPVVQRLLMGSPHEPMTFEADEKSKTLLSDGDNAEEIDLLSKVGEPIPESPAEDAKTISDKKEEIDDHVERGTGKKLRHSHYN
jgi:NhaP-type Na+/H+ or K+/H+ antiporter